MAALAKHCCRYCTAACCCMAVHCWTFWFARSAVAWMTSLAPQTSEGTASLTAGTFPGSLPHCPLLPVPICPSPSPFRPPLHSLVASRTQREVSWVLEDAVAAYRESSSSPWRPCSWQLLEQEIRAAQRQHANTNSSSVAGQQANAKGSGMGGWHANADGSGVSGWQVQLRAPVEQLRELWLLRLEV